MPTVAISNIYVRLFVCAFSSLCPTQTVQRLRWRPLGTGQPAHRREHWQLAVASADHSVRILVFPSSLVDGTS